MSKTFSLYGQEIEFSDSYTNYNNWRLPFHSLAVKGADKYMKGYYEGYGNLDKFIENGFNDGWKVIGEALQTSATINGKYYFIKRDEFLEKYGENCFSFWVDSFFEINDKYMEIVLKSEELDAYRTQRRLNRGRLIGGGFGISGAIKGIATAGAFNMAAGAAHGAVNLIGKGLSAFGNSFKKSKIYNNEEYKQKVWNGIYCSIFCIHLALCDKYQVPALSVSRQEKADELFSNIKNKLPHLRLKTFIEIFTLNPYKTEAYEMFIELIGDQDNEVEQMANFFGINLHEFKESLLLKTYNSLDFSTEESTQRAKILLENQNNKYGLQNSAMAATYMGKIKLKLENFDKIARTVDGQEFESRQEAETANRELEMIKGIMGDDYKNSEKNALDVLDKLNNTSFSSPIAEKYIDTVKSVVDDFDIKARTFNKKVYATREDAQNARSEELDRKARTYYGVVYASNEEVALAKVEDEKLREIMKNIDTKEFVQVIKAIEIIRKLDFTTKVKDRYLDKLIATREIILKDMKKIEEELGNKGILRRIFQGPFELIIVGLLITLFLQFGWIGIILSVLSLVWLIGSWSDRRGKRKKLHEFKKYTSQISL